MGIPGTLRVCLPKMLSYITRDATVNKSTQWQIEHKTYHFNHQPPYHPAPGHFHLPNLKLLSTGHCQPLPQALATLVLLSMSTNLPTLKTSFKWNHNYVSFSDWLTSSSTMSPNVAHDKGFLPA